MECLLLFGAGPLLVRGWLPAWLWPWVLGLGGVVALAWLVRRARPQPPLAPEQRRLRPMLMRFALCALLLIAVIALLAPERLFQLPRERPLFWLTLIAGYPLLSVLPQELVYRQLFARRYGGLFHGRWGWIVASALAFGWLHVVFDNWLAPLLCVLGGAFFAHTYAETRSLRLAVAEHSLYGMLVFTVGIGDFFYHAGERMLAGACFRPPPADRWRRRRAAPGSGACPRRPCSGRAPSDRSGTDPPSADRRARWQTPGRR